MFLFFCPLFYPFVRAFIEEMRDPKLLWRKIDRTLTILGILIFLPLVYLAFVGIMLFFCGSMIWSYWIVPCFKFFFGKEEAKW